MSQGYELPVEYEKYSDVVDGLVTDYKKFIEEDLVEFDGADIIKLISLVSRTFNRLKATINEIKEIDDTDRIELYTILIGIIIEKSLLASEQLTDAQKQQVEEAFEIGGLFQSIVGFWNDYYDKELNKMDTNKDKKVTKKEYENYMFKKKQQFCGCCGPENNRKAAQFSANCCFPILSGGDGIIDLSDEENDLDAL
jgi:hypothetical protein